MNNFLKTFFTLAITVFLFASVCFSYTLEEKVQMEANYILACQYINESDPNDPANGAINNVYGNPTWVVPRENAMAILGLMIATEVLNDNQYLERAQLAADYLVSVQDQTDGAWYNQYRYDQPYGDLAKSPTQTAEVMIAFYKLGYDADRSLAMRRGAEYLLLCQDNGYLQILICGGKDESGDFSDWNWTSDNSYAYQAFKAAEAWAIAEGDTNFAQTCAQAASEILDGINQYLYIPSEAHWHQIIDNYGFYHTQENKPVDWINYAPQMLDLPAEGVNSQAVGEWIHNTFQQTDGSCIGYGDGGEVRKYPGLSFQASLCWLDLGQTTYSNDAINWAENSGLWQLVNNCNGVIGGWIDWIQRDPPYNQAPCWQRFIDTSFYSIAAWTGGYNFNTFYTIHPDITWQQNEQTYYTGAASSQMVLNYIREGAGYPTLTQVEIYQYGHPDPNGQEMNPDEIDLSLGHFDPYDEIVSNSYDIYDSLAGGNPYQGYNFTVDTYNAISQEEYMRDICHWMAYIVTQGNWWQEGPLVARPNTPAVLPLLGTYNNWVTISGFITSLNPCPEPRSNPWNTPNFTIYGYWIKDPRDPGIGQDTYKTALECQTNYFWLLDNGDIYDGMYLQVAEPPAEVSDAQIEIASAKKDAKTFSLLKEIEQEELLSQPISLSEFNATLQVEEEAIQPKEFSWQDIVDSVLLSDRRIIEAFSGTYSARPFFVRRLDDETKNYYLIPFNNSKGLTSVVIVLDANEGFFKELSLTEKPVKFLNVDKKKALELIGEYIRTKEILSQRNKKYFSDYHVKMELVWEPNSFSASCYEPYWQIVIGNAIYIVTQDEEVILYKGSPFNKKDSLSAFAENPWLARACPTISFRRG